MAEGPPRIGVVGRSGGWSSEALADAIAERTGFRLLVDIEQMVLDLERGRALLGDIDLSTLDALIIKKVGETYGPSTLDRLELLRWLSDSGVRIFSNPSSIMRLIDRLACTVTLARANIPMPPTVVTESVDRAVDAVHRFGAAVLKPLYTTRARGMRVVSAAEGHVAERVRAFKEEGNPVIYVQRKVAFAERDYGLVFMGGQYIGAYARVRGEGSWNTTIHHGGRYEPHEASPAVVEVAKRAEALFHLDFTSVDIVIAEDGSPQVFEVSAFGGFRGLKEGLNLDPAARYAEYVIERATRRRAP